jgi:hypothetical protein
MAVPHNFTETDMKVTAVIPGIFAAAAMGVPHLAIADGMSNPMEARALCEKRGEAKSTEALKRCCSNLILLGDVKQQKKAEEQCVKGTAKQEGKK